MNSKTHSDHRVGCSTHRGTLTGRVPHSKSSLLGCYHDSLRCVNASAPVLRHLLPLS
jgi:hypothetical protein